MADTSGDNSGARQSTDSPEVTVITGGSSGIGAATAQRFAAAGSHVVLAARRQQPLSELATELETDEVETLAVPTDVTDPDDVAALFEATLDRFGRLDTVVVNAGTGEGRQIPLGEFPVEEFRTVTRTNVDGAFFTTREAVAALKQTQGTLVYVGSYKGKYPSTSTPVYAASKWWLRGFAASVAGRVGPDGVAVTLINPSGVPTKFGSQFRDETNEESLDPDQTITADDVANAIRYAADQESPAAAAEIDLYRQDIYERF